MWIRSQNKCGFEDIRALDIMFHKETQYKIVGFSNASIDQMAELGVYNSLAEALAVLDSIQARIDSGNTQTFQMPKAVSE